MYHLTTSFVTTSFVTDSRVVDCLTVGCRAPARHRIRGRFVFLGGATRAGRAASADV